MKRLLDKYRDRKIKERSKRFEWEDLYAIKPDPNVNHPDDEKALQEAKSSIGDYKLKTDPEYEPKGDEIQTVLTKYKELLQTREEIFQLRHNYNKKIFALRDRKVELLRYVQKQKQN